MNDKTIIFGNSSPDNKNSKNHKIPGSIFTFIVGALLVVGCFGAAAGGYFIFRLYQTLPSISQMQNIEQSLVSRMLGKDGRLVHEFHIEKRIWVPISKIPLDLQNAVIATEDRKFYSHWGVDVKRIFGAIVINVIRGGYAQGASTITQQLARNVYLTAKTSMIRKIREALTAVQLEKCYTKQEILELYLNQVYLGAGIYGVQAAADYYFNKPVSKLNTNECAMLAGIIQLPERYRPDKAANLERITARRNTVARALRSMKFIDQKTLKEITNTPIVQSIPKRTQGIGPYFVEMVRKYVADKYGDDVLYNGGLTIHTTIDPLAQDSAERAAHVEIRKMQRRLYRMFLDSTHFDRQLRIQRDTFVNHFDSIYEIHKEEWDKLPDSIRLRQAQISVIALDVPTGAIRVLIGGRNYEESKFNRALQARRQPGSAFKPFVYAAAMEHGFNPASVVLDQPITLLTPEGEWRPENYDHVFNGPITIRSALAKSVNLVAIQVLNKVGADTVISYAQRLGLTSPMNPVPSLAIGACEATPMEMTCAYGVFANHGIKPEPYFIEKIVDKNGRELEAHTPNEKEVLTPQTAFLMSSLMKTVVCCGTAASIPGLGFSRPAAGKTGTTNDYSDAWFIGFTPQYVCGVWTGVDERRSLGRGVTGSVTAIPVWVKTMLPLHKDLPIEDFKQPDSIQVRSICAESHLLAVRGCPRPVSEYFLKDSPIDTCDLHGPGKKLKASPLNVFGGRKVLPSTNNKKKKRLMF